MNRCNSCLLVRFNFPVIILCVTVYLILVKMSPGNRLEFILAALLDTCIFRQYWNANFLIFVCKKLTTVAILYLWVVLIQVVVDSCWLL